MTRPTILREPELEAGPPLTRYLPVAPNENPPPKSLLARAAAIVSAPLLGTPTFFPRRFDAGYLALRDGHAVRAIVPEHAMRFYGEALRLDLDPRTLTLRISDWVRHPQGVHWAGVAFLDSAEWRAALSPIDASPVHQEMLQVIAAGADYRDTDGYRAMIRALESGAPMKRNGVRLASVAAIDAYFAYCHDLAASVRAHGVLRRRRAGAFRGLQRKHRGARPSFLNSTELDVGVAIDADGTIIRHLGGKHRTAIASALRLPLPVEIRMVHSDWLRAEIARRGLPPYAALREGLAALAAATRPAGG